jgi:hypothetical protein
MDSNFRSPVSGEILGVGPATEREPRLRRGRTDPQPAANASDDAVPTQARDSSGVETEPLGKHFGGVLAEKWRRLNGGRDAIEVVRARDDHRSGFAVAPQNHVEGRPRR